MNNLSWFLSLHTKKEICPRAESLVPLLLSSMGFTAIFIFFLLISPSDIQNRLEITNGTDISQGEECDLFQGQWIPELSVSHYTDSSCPTILRSHYCFKHGRRDTDFLNWRWKPEKCHLSRFDPKLFFSIVRGKTLGFVGDSVARNHLESLLCLLSQVEVPIVAYNDETNQRRIWEFPKHDFKLKMIWTRFLVAGKERMINNASSSVFDLYLDQFDNNWDKEILTTDYVIISTGHWFFRKMYLYKDDKELACIFCNETNVTHQHPEQAIRMAIRAALTQINHCKKCKGTVTLLRTFSPSHFENGFWNTGGNCNRTIPFEAYKIDSFSFEQRIRNVQVEEMENARKVGAGSGKTFEVLDVTMAMLMRPDGHPSSHWDNQWMKGYNDCVHWCLPGPIDMWNELLLSLLPRLT